MNSELVIHSTPSEVSIAWLEDRRMVELSSGKKDNNFSVGDIYLGRVKKIMPGLNAAFVDIGYEKDAFLHYLDLGPRVRSLHKYIKDATTGKRHEPLLNDFQFEPEIEKTGKISQVLSANQLVMVQIAKEPIANKGPRITSELSLAGRFIVLVPFSEAVSISQKIKSTEERTRLKRLVGSIKPKNFGIIIRTVAEGKKVAELDKDIQDLVTKWKASFEALKTAQPGQKVLGEMARTSTLLRDVLNPNFNSVHINDPVLAEEVRSYLKSIAPEQTDIVKLYKGRASIFDHFGIDKQTKQLFGRTVSLPGGAYLVIEHTEAMHVIDVNSGGRKPTGDSQEENALQVNVNAAKEIARQLRLRDIGGIIVVDFIDMHKIQNKKELFNALKNEMKTDRARHNIIPPSKFGLVQITRQRVRPQTNITTVEKCPACEGSGEIKSSSLLIDEIENNIRYLVQEQNEKSFTLSVSPYIEAYLKKGLLSMQWSWFRKYKQWVKVKSQKSYHFLEYHFFNKAGEEIKM